MEDDLKISKIEPNWLHLTQILDLNFVTNWRWPQNMEYLSNHWSDPTQIKNLSLGDQTKLYKCLKWSPPVEDDLKNIYLWIEVSQ